MMITQSYLHEWFYYLDGELYRKNDINFFLKKDSKIGGIYNVYGKPVKTATIGNEKYKIAELVWIFHNDIVPENYEIVFLDKDKFNTTIENLNIRELKNKCLCKTTSGNFYYLEYDKKIGAFYHKIKKCFVAQIKVKNEIVLIGEYSTLSKAIKSFVEYKDKINKL